MNNERGAAAVIGILIFLLLAVLVVISIVVGLGSVVDKGSSTSKMFNDESKIKPMVENFREKKRELAARIEEHLDGPAEPEPAPETDRASLSTDDRLGAVAKRLEKEPEVDEASSASSR